MVIKEYCIIYEEEKQSLAFPSGGWEYTVSTTVHEITIPAIVMEDAIIYATRELEIKNIKEVFEL